MNLTFTQAVERTKDLSGEIKAARAHEADCAADHEAKKRIAEIAGEAHNKASAHCIELEEERERLADHMAALVRKTGEALETDPVDAPAFNSVFAQDALAHAESRMNGAFDESTS